MHRWIALVPAAGCFSAPPDVGTNADEASGSSTNTTATATGDAEGESDPTGSPSTTAEPTASGSDAGDGGTTLATAGDGSATTNETGCSDCAAYGEACEQHEDCESGMCFDPPHEEADVCTVACEPAEGGCSAVGLTAFCLRVTLDGYGCFEGLMDTGRDSEDGSVFPGGPTRHGTIDDGDDVDAIYFRMDEPGFHTLYVEPSSHSLDVEVTLFWEGEFVYSNNLNDPGVVEISPINVDGKPGLFPDYGLALISGAADSQGGYGVWLAEGPPPQ